MTTPQCNMEMQTVLHDGSVSVPRVSVSHLECVDNDGRNFIKYCKHFVARSIKLNFCNDRRVCHVIFNTELNFVIEKHNYDKRSRLHSDGVRGSL